MWKRQIPCFLTYQCCDTEDEKHQKHPSVLKIIHMRRIEDSMGNNLQMRGI
eukprot:Gb_12625 [translate_table: standard]